MRIYATPQEFADWLGKDTPPAGAEQALRAASLDIDTMLLTAHYPVDEQGMPTQPEHVDALRDATCAQAEYARGLGDPNNTGAQQYAEAQIGSVRLVRTNQPPANMPGRMSPQAQQILQQAALTGAEPVVW